MAPLAVSADCDFSLCSIWIRDTVAQKALQLFKVHRNMAKAKDLNSFGKEVVVVKG